MMKRVMMVLAALCLTVSSAYAEAPTREHKFDMGFQGGFAFNTDNVDDTGYLELSTSYGVNPWLAVGLEGGWQESSAGPGEDAGTADILFDFIVRGDWWSDKDLVPYLLIGIGGVGQWVDLDNRDDIDDTSFAFKLGAGIDWFFNPTWAANFEISYLFSDTNLDHTTIGSSGYDTFELGAGIKHVF